MNFWDNAYSNSRHIVGGDDFPALWAEHGARFRQNWTDASLDLPYGRHPRERFDLFRPANAAKGIVIFVHGGYWMAFDKSSSSHLAAGALAQGWAVAMPSYRLCPEARIGDITEEIGQAAIEIAGLVDGPLILAGHSAGGHLVTRLCCENSPLPPAIRTRLRKALSISGLHDLRPLLQTAMNQTLRLDLAEATRESPALLTPLPNIAVTCWVGSQERPEFRRQSALLANIWSGLGARMSEHVVSDRHHFDVIADLTDPRSRLTCALFTDIF